MSCFVCHALCVTGSDLSASAVLYAHDRYCRGLGRVLVLILHRESTVCWIASWRFPASPIRTKMLSALIVATAHVHAPAGHLHARASRACVSASAATAASGAIVEAPALKPPRNREDMLDQASKAILRAREDGSNRFTLRLFLPKGEDGNLYPPDESWEGGIMQLYAACTPMVRDILRRISNEIAGVPPSLKEQRIDPSGVDGEAVWFAQSSEPKDDAVGVVQPSAESMPTIRELNRNCGPTRSLLMVNPQWKERDDPFDALSRKGGFLGALGSVLGGKDAVSATHCQKLTCPGLKCASNASFLPAEG